MSVRITSKAFKAVQAARKLGMDVSAQNGSHKSDVTPKLQSTSNYGLFQQNTFNRDVQSIAKLVESMKKHGYIAAYPIHCIKDASGKLIIKAGHHRFEAARSLGLAVLYIVCEDAATVSELERATRPWSVADYVMSHARSGLVDFISLIDFSERTGIGFSQAAAMLSGGSAHSHHCGAKLKSGEFRIKNTEHAEKVGRVVTSLRSMQIQVKNIAAFVGALSMCIWLDEFDVDVFLSRVACNPGMFIKQADRDQYLELIERIYNYKARQNRVAIAFLAREASRNRCPVPSDND